MRLFAKHPTKKFSSFSNDHGIGNYGPRTYLESSLSGVTHWLCHAKSLYNSGRVVQEAPLELWANVKQRALDQALGEINNWAGSLSEGTELRFSNHGEKTCDTLRIRFAMLNFAITTKAKPNSAGSNL
jgi:hypothetical protein